MFDPKKCEGQKNEKEKKMKKIKNRFKVNKLFIYIILNLLYIKNLFFNIFYCN